MFNQICMVEEKMSNELEFSDLEEIIHEDVLQSSVYECDDPSDCWVNLHLNRSAHAQQIDPLQSQPIYSVQQLADTTMEVCEDYASNPSLAANHFKLPPLPSGLTELSMDSPLKEGQKVEEIRVVNPTHACDFPEFEEIDGTFDTKSLDSDGTEEGSSEFYSGFPPLIYTENFQALINPSSDDASTSTGLNEARVEQGFFIEENLDPVVNYDQSLSGSNSRIDGDNALMLLDMADDPKSSSSEELTILPIESNKSASIRKRKNQSLNLVNLHGDDFRSIKKISCGKSASEEENIEAGAVRDLELAGSSTCLELVEDKLRTISSTIDELSNAINLISAENINLRSKLSFVNQPADCCAKSGAMPLGTLALRHGSRVLPGNYISPLPIPGLLLNMRFKSCHVGAEKLDSRRIVGATAMGFCFIIMLLLPFNWRLGSQNTKDSKMPISGRNFNLFIRELEQTNKNASNANHCNAWSDPQDRHGISSKERIVDGAEQKTLVAKSAMGNFTGMKMTSLIAGLSNKCKGRKVSAPRGGTAVPLNASKLFFPTANVKCLRFDGSLTGSAIKEQKGPNGHSVRRDRRKKVEGGMKSKHISLAAKTSLALQDLQSFEKIILKACKRYKRGAAQRMKRKAFRFLKALPTRRKVYTSTKSLGKLESYVFMHQRLLQQFAGDIMSTATCTKLFQYETFPEPETYQANKTDFFKNTSSDIRQCKADHFSPIQEENAFLSLPDAKHSLALLSIPDSYNDEIAVWHGESLSDRHKHKRSRSRPFVVVSIVASSYSCRDKSYKHRAGSDTTLKIFVIVRIDGVKYVAYSCFLTSPGPKSQMVTG